MAHVLTTLTNGSYHSRADSQEREPLSVFVDLDELMDSDDDASEILQRTDEYYRAVEDVPNTGAIGEKRRIILSELRDLQDILVQELNFLATW